MSTVERSVPNEAYNGLAELTPSLPASSYYDPAVYERELSQVWYRNWNYVGRASALKERRSFRTFEIGTQRVFVLRGDDGELRAFHNTCRHRGAALCRGEGGTMPGPGIVCPYHSWRYSQTGDLVRTTSQVLPAGFDRSALGLLPVAVHEWNGFVFVNLAKEPPPFTSGFDAPESRFDAWPMNDLVIAHSLTKQVACNWKVFWENYNECLHCPTVHPSLCQLVPIYSRGYMEERDDPSWKDHAESADAQYRDARYTGGLRPGAETWSRDGRATVAGFDLPERERRAGYAYVTILPTMFVVAHVDYVRTVRLRPLAPEQTELSVEYLVAPQTLRDPGFDLKSIVDFTSEVLMEDAEVAEINQRGLRSIAFDRGVLMPEEYALRQFHDWVKAELARP